MYVSFGGLLTAEGDMAQENTSHFSCESTDDEPRLVYYNYCHFNPLTVGGSPSYSGTGGWDLCGFIKNHIRTNINFLGMVSSSPLDPAFISPPIPDRVGQSRGIKLSYFTCKRKLDKLGDKAIKALLAGKVTHVPSDFKPNSECEESCQCLRSLIIIMHGEEPWIRKMI